MSKKDTLSVTVDYSALKHLFEYMPRVSNSEMNRGYKKIVADWTKVFSKNRLRKPIMVVRRKGTFNSPKGQPVIPKKMRKVGFIALLKGRERIQGKSVEVRNSSKLITGREKGEPIVAKPGKWLYIHSKAGSKYAFGKKSRKGRLGGGAAQFKWQKKQKNYHGKRGKYPITAKMKRVGPFPLLGFRASWKSYKPHLPRHYDKIVDRIIGRVQYFIDKRRAS